MQPTRFMIIAAVAMCCADSAVAQVENVLLDLSSGRVTEVDIIDCQAGMLRTIEKRRISRWVDVVDTTRISLDSIRSATLSEGSSVIGTFIPIGTGNRYSGSPS